MNPLPLFLLAISLPLLLGGCGVEEPFAEATPVEEKQQEVKTEEPVPETTPKLEGVSYEQLKRKGGLTYHNDPNIPYTGKTYVLYPSGEIQEKFKFKNGIIDGSSFSWHKNGQKKSHTHAKDGKFHGLQTYWYENGQKRIESTWKEFLRHGLETQWHENGQKKSEQNYKDGKPVDGSLKYWNSKGEPIP